MSRPDTAAMLHAGWYDCMNAAVVFWGGGGLIGLKTENVRLLGARIHRQSVSLVCRNFQSCGERERWHKQDQAFHTEKN